MNAMMLSNVYMYRGESKEGVEIHKGLGEVVYSLATTNPTWTFECRKGFRDIDEVHVHAESQRIGKLGTRYSSRAGTTAISITSDNVTARSNTITTADVKKAIREARRFFAPKSISNLMAEKLKIATSEITSQAYRKNSLARDHLGTMRSAIDKFALQTKRQEFTEWANTLNKKSEIANALAQYDTVQEEISVLKELEGNNDKILVWRDKGKYIIKVLDNVQTYDDNTIPEEYRAKLGMLKLVDVKVAIGSIGCRVEEDLFLLLMP